MNTTRGPFTLGDENDAVQQVFLQPASLFCSSNPSVVSTVLGSCVAISLWHPELRCGGVNHFLLPECGSKASDLRYGDCSTRRLIKAMHNLGCDSKDLVAKVFGGSAVLTMSAPKSDIGAQNVQFALAYLQQQGVPVVVLCTGGRCGRVIRVHTHTGDVWVRPIPASQK